MIPQPPELASPSTPPPAAAPIEIEEYRALRAELLLRLGLQQQLQQYALAFIGAGLPIAVLMVDRGVGWVVLYVAPFFAFVMSIAMLTHDRMIRQLAAYINTDLAAALERGRTGV